MPPRKSRSLKSLKGRVQHLARRGQFDNLLSESSRRLVVVLFFKSSNFTAQTQKVQAHLNQVSRQLSNVGFAELDVSQPDCQGLAAANGVTSLPSYVLFRDSDVVEVLSGQSLGSLGSRCIQLAGRQQKSTSESSSLWKGVLSAVALMGAIVTAGYIAQKAFDKAEDTRPFGVRLADIDDKLLKARMRLAYLVKSNMKGSRLAQERKVRHLEAYRQGLLSSRKNQGSQGKSRPRPNSGRHGLLPESQSPDAPRDSQDHSAEHVPKSLRHRSDRVDSAQV